MKDRFEIILESILKVNYFGFINNKHIVKELSLSYSYAMYLFWVSETTNSIILSQIHSQTAIIYIWSTVEALLYEYVFESLKKQDPSKLKRYCKNIIYTEKQVPWWIFKDNLILCEKKEKDIEFKEDINFQALINWVKDYKLLSNKIIEYLDDIRQKRNIVHLKVLINFKNWWNDFNDALELIDKYTEIFHEIKTRFIKSPHHKTSNRLVRK